jgi:UDP-N-acetylmuramoylalanine--D-glutamate ligase
MGLGLHGGGAASARFFASRGARVTVTDMKSESELDESLARLTDLPIRYVLGEHREEDFTEADLVIKNPAVPAHSRFLSLAREIDTDVGIFLRFNRRPVLAVTGSKGKSTTVSALHAALLPAYPDARLGGNITVSPLSFLNECLEPAENPVVLELSSWQLADLPDLELLAPRIAVITNIFPDHQNRYANMEEYIRDKERIFLAQKQDQCSVFNRDDPRWKRFAGKTPARPFFVSARPLPDGTAGAFLQHGRGWYRPAADASTGTAAEEEILTESGGLPGRHNRLNLLTAGLCARLFGVPAETVRQALAAFGGIEHRLELVAEIDGSSWYNDSAATIPDATEAALESFASPVHLIAGGTDKELDYSPFTRLITRASSVHLLAGSATERMEAILRDADVSYHGPYDSLVEAVASARAAARPGEAVLFSPGATSFGMFANEFDRGRRFKHCVMQLEERAKRGS